MMEATQSYCVARVELFTWPIQFQMPQQFLSTDGKEGNLNEPFSVALRFEGFAFH